MSKLLELRRHALALSTDSSLDLTDRVDLVDLAAGHLLPDMLWPCLVLGSPKSKLHERLLRHAPPGGRNPVMASDPLATLSGNAAGRGGTETSAANKTEPFATIVVDLLPNLLAPEHWSMVSASCFEQLSLRGVVQVIALLTDEPFVGDDTFPLGDGRVIRSFPREDKLPEMLEAIGFHGIHIRLLYSTPLLCVRGRELRAFLISAYKGKQGRCLDQGHAVAYRGPWHQVTDDDGHVYRRGERTAVCEKTFGLLQRPPYVGSFISFEPYQPPALDQAPLFDCNTPQVRPAAVTKGITQIGAADQDCCCDPSDSDDCCRGPSDGQL